MDSYLTSFLVIFLLVLISLRNGFETKRGLTCVAVLWTTAPGYFIYDSEYYFPLLEIFGTYGYQSLTPVLAIMALYLIRDRLSTLLMCLFTVLIFGNTYFFWLEGQGYKIQDVQQGFVWLVFFIEVALMLSLRLTNGIHGVVQRFKLRRDPAADSCAGDSGTYSTKDNTIEAKG